MRRAPAMLGAVSAKFAAVVGAAALLAIHLARPDLDPSWHVLSECSIGRYGWLMRVAFASLAFASLSLFVALSGMTKTRSESVGRWLLLGVAAGSAIGGIFDIDPIGTLPSEASTAAELHNLGSLLGNGSMIGGALLLNRSIGRRNEWASVRLPLTIATHIS